MVEKKITKQYFVIYENYTKFKYLGTAKKKRIHINSCQVTGKQDFHMNIRHKIMSYVLTY